MKRTVIILGAICLLTALFFYGALLYPHSGELPSGEALQPPSGEHLLGTDHLGIDVFAQLSRGYFRSLAIGLGAAALTFMVGGFLGVAAGYAGGWLDTGISFLIHLTLSVPQLPIMIVIGAFFGQSTGNVIAIIAAFSWAPVAKLLRARTRSVRQTPYICLAQSYGGSGWYVVRRHMLPELLPLLVVNTIGVIGSAIVQESALAFLGLSDPLAKSWGLMIARARSFPGIFFTDFWKWWLLPPVAALILTTVLLRLLSRGLEEHWLARR